MTPSKQTKKKKKNEPKPAAKTKRAPKKKQEAEASTVEPKKKRKPAPKRKRKEPTPAPPSPAPSPPASPPGPPPLEHAQDLLRQVEFALMGIEPDLEASRTILEKHHPPTIRAKENPNPAPTTIIPEKNDEGTGGHSNTNHQVVLTGDPVLDKLREYQRHYQQRQRLLVPETKGNDRWDKPKVFGQRRRRIHREVDKPEAPQEPPPVGFTVFVGQMTTKIRHDRIQEPHHQPTVMQEIAKLWKDDMTHDDRTYYNEFAKEARAEYTKQQMEYRASGQYTSSDTFIKMSPVGPWIRKNKAHQNALEREIADYETVEFPPRPPEFDEDFQNRDWKSKLNRKLKLRKLIKDYHNPVEQAIVQAAIQHAKHHYREDQAALLRAASQECVVKLQEVKRAVRMAEAPPPQDDESQQAALRMIWFSEDGAMVEVNTSEEEEDDEEEEFVEPPMEE